VAVDSDDLVVGATRAARLTLGLNAQKLARPIPAADLIGRAPRDSVEAAARAALHRALARARGNVSKAASELGMSRSTLHRKMNQFSLRR
jgi:transcriptional regulator of acetoin/glycerol metabolism